MNKQEATKWAEALESGEFKQGTRYLYNENKMCCLGVLAHINEALDSKGLFNGNSQVLDGGFMGVSECGMSINGRVLFPYFPGNLKSKVNGTHRSLTQLNDTGVSFVEIAQIIRNIIPDLPD